MFDEEAINGALRIADDAWTERRRSPFVQLRTGSAPARLPDLSIEEVRRHSQVGRDLLTRLDEIDVDALPHDVALTLRLVRFYASTWSREADWYWTVVEPSGIGQLGMFLPSAYCGGPLLNVIHGFFADFSFRDSGDTDRYLALLADYARLIDQLTLRTAGQEARGMRMPKAQVLQARAFLAGFRSAAHARLAVSVERVAMLSLTKPFLAEVERRIRASIEPAFDRSLEFFSESYLDRAPESVGLSQYPDGAEIYAALVKQLTTLDLTPEEVHARGRERMAQIERSIAEIHAECGFENDPEGFLARLQQDARWRAESTVAVEARFQRYIDRVKPHLTKHFSVLPRASYGVAALPKALEGSMTYGYYEPPAQGRCEGRYRFNAANLTQHPLAHLATLTYHELMPGHHLHFATQQENDLLHPLRAYSFVNAYVEGWAEYAAAFAGELGMYETPEERYGRLAMDAFLTSRLIVDTGMNALGWSLERARQYMRTHARMAEAEILTESLRYSCDVPAQALAYKLGDTHILALRERMRGSSGAAFSLKDFHHAILGPGAVPLADLAWHVEHLIGKKKVRERQLSSLQDQS